MNESATFQKRDDVELKKLTRGNCFAVGLLLARAACVQGDSCDGWLPSLEGNPGVVLGLRRSSPLIPDQYFAAPRFSHVTWREDILERGITHDSDENPVKMMLKLNSSKTYLDVGANCGTTTLPVAAMKTMHRVHGFEPVPAMFNLLCASKAFGKAMYHGRLQYWHVAVTNTSTPLRLFIPADREDHAAAGRDSRVALQNLRTKSSKWRPSPTPSAVELEVRSVMLDNFMETTLPLHNVTLLKIDTQGHELHVLRGAEKLLRAQRIQALYAENDPGLTTAAGVNPHDILEFMASVGFMPFKVEQFVIVQDTITRVPGVEPLASLDASSGAGSDILWLPLDNVGARETA